MASWEGKKADLEAKLAAPWARGTRGGGGGGAGGELRAWSRVLLIADCYSFVLQTARLLFANGYATPSPSPWRRWRGVRRDAVRHRRLHPGRRRHGRLWHDGGSADGNGPHAAAWWPAAAPPAGGQPGAATLRGSFHTSMLPHACDASESSTLLLAGPAVHMHSRQPCAPAAPRADCAAAAGGAASQRILRRGDAAWQHRPLRRLQQRLQRAGHTHRAAAAGAATRRPSSLPLVRAVGRAGRRGVPLLGFAGLGCGCLCVLHCLLACAACQHVPSSLIAWIYWGVVLSCCRFHLGCLPASSWHEARARGVGNLRNVSSPPAACWRYLSPELCCEAGVHIRCYTASPALLRCSCPPPMPHACESTCSCQRRQRRRRGGDDMLCRCGGGALPAGRLQRAAGCLQRRVAGRRAPAAGALWHCYRLLGQCIRLMLHLPSVTAL